MQLSRASTKTETVQLQLNFIIKFALDVQISIRNTQTQMLGLVYALFVNHPKFDTFVFTFHAHSTSLPPQPKLSRFSHLCFEFRYRDGRNEFDDK